MIKPKQKLLAVFLFLMVFVSIVYLLLCHLQDNYKNVQWTGERCSSELKSVKYQLNVVTEYKNKLDKLLTDLQKSQETEAIKFKDMMENCRAMQQQNVLCQLQFEDLQSECKRVKENYDIKVKEIEQLHNNHQS